MKTYPLDTAWTIYIVDYGEIRVESRHFRITLSPHSFLSWVRNQGLACVFHTLPSVHPNPETQCEQYKH